MELLSEYYVKALAMDRAAFAARYPHLFLLKHPTAAAPAQGSDDPFADEDDEGQESELTRIVGALADGAVFDDQGPMAAEWRVAALVRRLNAPPMDRIVVGRSPVLCDVVLPFASVSKVHAHFHPEGADGMTLFDVESSNGTFVNDRRVEGAGATSVRVGDRIRLGHLEVELVDAGRFYAVLTTQP